MIGIGAMIQSLSGNDHGANALREAIGKKITAFTLTEEEGSVIQLRFEDGTGLDVTDTAQSCCERRYITGDDDLSTFVGATLVGMSTAEAPERKSAEVHEVQFLNIITSSGPAQFCTHNEHNGYYGGFWVQVTKVPA